MFVRLCLGWPAGPVPAARLPPGSAPLPQVQREAAEQEAQEGLVLRWGCALPSPNAPGITEAENIEKRWQEYTEELYKKDLHDPDNHDGVITHLEPASQTSWKSKSIGP